MNFPLNAFHSIGLDAGLVLSLFVGIGFGFMLEKGGFGSSRILAGIFYGKDWRVLKVMFTAIVTAMVGLYTLHGLGYVALDQVALKSTFLWGQIAGGLLLGIGFVTAGYCPGTSVVGAVSGKLDALFVMAGLVIGIGVFEEGYALWKGFYGSGYMGELTISQWSGIPYAWITLGVVLMALGAFAAVEYFERGRDLSALRSWLARTGSLLGAAGVLVLVAQLAGPGEARAMNAPAETAYVPTLEPLELASWSVEGRANYLLIDLRGEGAQPELLGAIALAPEDLLDLRRRPAFAPDRVLVVADEADDGLGREVVASLNLAGHRAVQLKGGVRAFADLVLTDEVANPAALAYRSLVRGTSFFDGAAPPPKATKKAPPQRKKKKSTGCS